MNPKRQEQDSMAGIATNEDDTRIEEVETSKRHNQTASWFVEERY